MTRLWRNRFAGGKSRVRPIANDEDDAGAGAG
jgi:hypothetical protein